AYSTGSGRCSLAWRAQQSPRKCGESRLADSSEHPLPSSARIHAGPHCAYGDRHRQRGTCGQSVLLLRHLDCSVGTPGERVRLPSVLDVLGRKEASYDSIAWEIPTYERLTRGQITSELHAQT